MEDFEERLSRSFVAWTEENDVSRSGIYRKRRDGGWEYVDGEDTETQSLRLASMDDETIFAPGVTVEWLDDEHVTMRAGLVILPERPAEP